MVKRGGCDSIIGPSSVVRNIFAATLSYNLLIFVAGINNVIDTHLRGPLLKEFDSKDAMHSFSNFN